MEPETASNTPQNPAESFPSDSPAKYGAAASWGSAWRGATFLAQGVEAHNADEARQTMRASRAGFTTEAAGSGSRGKGTPALVGAMLASLLVFLGAAAGPATAQTETPTSEPQASEAPATTDTTAALAGDGTTAGTGDATPGASGPSGESADKGKATSSANSGASSNAAARPGPSGDARNLTNALAVGGEGGDGGAAASLSVGVDAVAASVGTTGSSGAV
ncbi:MAG: hypothetical protein QOJ69_673, partial [Actinomycetota bacterium]|nr:hypothetical protein [Actinomycetota bacterium]